MTIVKSLILHRLTKSMGDNTFCRFRGKTILKGKVSSNHSCTLPQQQQRLRMKTLMELCDLFDPAIQMGFPQRPIAQSPGNAFVQTNKDVVEVSEKLEVTINYEQIACSKGKLELPELTVKADAEARTLTFSHEAEDFGKHAEPTDMLYAVLLEKQKSRTKVFPLNTRESAGMVALTLPKGWEIANLEVYVFVLSENKRKSSKTLYLSIE